MRGSGRAWSYTSPGASAAQRTLQLRSGGSLGLHQLPSYSTANYLIPTALLTDAQALDDLLVPFGVPIFKILEQAAPLTDHNQQAASRRMVLAVHLEMAVEVGNPLTQDRNLHFG